MSSISLNRDPNRDRLFHLVHPFCPSLRPRFAPLLGALAVVALLSGPAEAWQGEGDTKDDGGRGSSHGWSGDPNSQSHGGGRETTYRVAPGFKSSWLGSLPPSMRNLFSNPYSMDKYGKTPGEKGYKDHRGDNPNNSVGRHY